MVEDVRVDWETVKRLHGSCNTAVAVANKYAVSLRVVLESGRHRHLDLGDEVHFKKPRTNNPETEALRRSMRQQFKLRVLTHMPSSATYMDKGMFRIVLESTDEFVLRRVVVAPPPPLPPPPPPPPCIKRARDDDDDDNEFIPDNKRRVPPPVQPQVEVVQVPHVVSPVVDTPPQPMQLVDTPPQPVSLVDLVRMVAVTENEAEGAFDTAAEQLRKRFPSWIELKNDDAGYFEEVRCAYVDVKVGALLKIRGYGNRSKQPPLEAAKTAAKTAWCRFLNKVYPERKQPQPGETTDDAEAPAAAVVVVPAPAAAAAAMLGYNGCLPTLIDGIPCRSRLEARFVVFLKHLALTFEYERTTFGMEDGTRYTPDFYIPSLKLHIELKPAFPLFEEIAKCMELCKRGHATVLLYGDKFIAPFSSTEMHGGRRVYDHSKGLRGMAWDAQGKRLAGDVAFVVFASAVGGAPKVSLCAVTEPVEMQAASHPALVDAYNVASHWSF